MAFTKEPIAFGTTGEFSGLFLDYIEKKERVRSLYSEHFDPASVQKYLAEHTFSYVDRNVLVTDLFRQNETIILSEASRKNIERLAEATTFTVTTGHQLCLFTGPLYFIYKILTAINICAYLNKQFPSGHFVPVYWMASEDHDFEEINHAHLFGKTVSWKTDQTGKVGNFALSGMQEVLAELGQILGESDAAKKLHALFTAAYSNKNLAEATRFLVNELFGQYGLVILDGDSKALKQLFEKEIRDELFSGFSYKAVSETNAYFDQQGYDKQVNPREINLFYAKGNIRERIEKQNDQFKVLNTPISFSKQEIENLLKNEIEVFSPNVILRPVYQQRILPNIAYAGGPGEIAYWLQLKKEFDVAGVHFPILLPRKFALIFDSGSVNKLQKLQVEKADMFTETDALVKKLISSDAEQVNFSADKEKLSSLFADIKQQTETIDKTLGGTVEGELQKALKGIENIEQKIVRALKTKNETAINQLKTVKQKLFPENSIQERYDNFSPFVIRNETFIADLKEAFETNLDDLGNYLLLSEQG
jgi:bacillithiol biosynthesis cysteine-adding enzyme BshC